MLSDDEEPKLPEADELLPESDAVPDDAAPVELLADVELFELELLELVLFELELLELAFFKPEVFELEPLFSEPLELVLPVFELVLLDEEPLLPDEDLPLPDAVSELLSNQPKQAALS